MATLIKHQGLLFEDLFDPDIMGDGPVAGRCFHNGQPLRFAHIQYGRKRADVNFRVNNVDVSNLWAAKGTASYISRGGVPDHISDLQVVPPTGGSSSAFVSFRATGQVMWTTDAGAPGVGTWAPGTGSPGAAYDIKYQNLGVSSGGSLNGADNVWRQISSDQPCSLGIFASNGQSRSASASVNVQIRRRSDGAILLNFNLNFSASVVSDG
ncbi:hypothetical protein [Lysobacter gummosus]|uniref:Uncharacterized protein n=1 Tax=Lysobacter gummosus TaxID=262324 RepID=A0ABY3X699_9GAMM|nr:hypothetical protein [Lysobacter gummosus]UNP28097.1 hypothetical protein MOV92_16535 [Lysobacter gummosus]